MLTKPSFLFTALLFVYVAACSPIITATAPVEQTATIPAVLATTVPPIPTTQAPPPTSLPASATPGPAEPNPTVTLTTTPFPTLAPGSNPALSIAYPNHGAVYIWTEGRGARSLADAQDVVAIEISDDGQWVAYLCQDLVDYAFQEVWAVNTIGTPTPRLLVSNADLKDITPPDPDKWILGAGILDFSWRPQTHELAFSTYILLEGVGSALNHDLRLVNTDSLTKTTLLDNGQGGIFNYSPDGNQIALSNPESISLMAADGTDLRAEVLTFPSVITYSEYEYHPHPYWAQDSQSLLVAIPPHDPLADPRPPTGLWRMPADGTQAELVGYIPAIPFAWLNNGFSPDSRRVAYVEAIGKPEENQRQLHILRLDGSNDAVYARGESLEFMGWSPDSQYFIYVIHGGENKGIYVGDLTAQPLMITSDPGAITGIQWVDDSRFAYLISNGSGWELKICNVKGYVLELIDTLRDTSPVFDVVSVGG